jgi:cob(I)alamin adenosyltransferase
MSILKQVAEYLYLKKKDPNQTNTQWVKYMHGINRLSILLFLVAMVILAIKLLVKKGN